MTSPLASPDTFIKANTTRATPGVVPEIELFLATEITPIWQASETFLEQHGIEPPFWAFAWPGSQLIARHMLDHPEQVRGKRVLDVACGCGLAAIAAARAGAAYVTANDIDPMALHATTLNAALNAETIHLAPGDLIGTMPDCDLMVVGDVCYNEDMATRIVPWLVACSRRFEVWLCDPGRHYAPKLPLHVLARADIPTTEELESAPSRPTTLFRLRDISG